METAEYKDNEMVLYKIRGKVRLPHKKPEVVDCFVTKNHVLIDAVEPIKIPLSLIQDITVYDIGYPAQAREPSAGTATLTFLDDQNKERKLSLETAAGYLAYFKQTINEAIKRQIAAEAEVAPKRMAKRVFLVFVGLVCLSSGVLIFLELSLPSLMLPTTGVATQGVVERLVESEWVDAGPGGGESKYHVYYSFVLPDGEVIKGHTQLSSSDWFSLRVGQTVKVLYLPNNPGHNSLADYRLWEASTVMMIVFPPLFGGIGILLLLYAVRPQKVESWARKFGMSKVPK